MDLSRAKFLIAMVLLASAPSLRAQTATDASGHWEGTVQAPNMEVKLEIDLAKTSKGELAGTINIPAQNLRGLRLANFSAEGRSVAFQIKGAPGERAFTGVLSADGQSISGDYKQAGYTMPFHLTRIGEPRLSAAIRNAAISKELEGTWNGTFDNNGIQRRIVLTLSNRPDGTADGSIVNVDEGLEIPIGAITQNASNVTLDLQAVGGSYAGALNASATELVGTYTSGQAVAVSLTFRRPGQ